MLSVEDALSKVLSHALPLAVEHVPLNGALGRVLGEAIVSGIDSPPFDKALMDGFAILASDTAGGSATLKVLETLTAGEVPTQVVTAGHATRIMTGAPLPAGADAVVPVEKTMAAPQPNTVQVGVAVRPGANVLYRGESMKAGEPVFAAGQVLRPQDLGLLAELGVAKVPVRKRPRVAILATGDELVPPDETPGAGQIRNSNESLLVGLVTACGCEAVPLGIARDTKEELASKIAAGLACDLLILSGGVSAGALDLVPGVLKEAGVEEVFHKVNVKPGKPVWFGVKGAGASETSASDTSLKQVSCLVFGLPGNPVSTLVCFELFARSAIDRLLGIEPCGPATLTATITAAFDNQGNRPVYHPARIASDDKGRLTVRLVRWAGSGDLRGTVEANGVAVFDAERSYAAGETIGVQIWSGSTSG